VIAGSRAALGPLEVRLDSALRSGIAQARATLGERLARLDAMSPLGVLSRGYAIATTASGRAIRAIEEVSSGEKIEVRVHRGSFSATVDSVGADQTKGTDSAVEEQT